MFWKGFEQWKKKVSPIWCCKLVSILTIRLDRFKTAWNWPERKSWLNGTGCLYHMGQITVTNQCLHLYKSLSWLYTFTCQRFNLNSFGESVPQNIASDTCFSYRSPASSFMYCAFLHTIVIESDYYLSYHQSELINNAFQVTAHTVHFHI